MFPTTECTSNNRCHECFTNCYDPSHSFRMISTFVRNDNYIIVQDDYIIVQDAQARVQEDKIYSSSLTSPFHSFRAIFFAAHPFNKFYAFLSCALWRRWHARYML